MFNMREVASYYVQKLVLNHEKVNPEKIREANHKPTKNNFWHKQKIISGIKNNNNRAFHCEAAKQKIHPFYIVATDQARERERDKPVFLAWPAEDRAGLRRNLPERRSA